MSIVNNRISSVDVVGASIKAVQEALDKVHRAREARASELTTVSVAKIIQGRTDEWSPCVKR